MAGGSPGAPLTFICIEALPSVRRSLLARWGGIVWPAAKIVAMDQELAAAVNDLNVTLSWNANPETDIIGYRVLRNGLALLPDEPMSDLTATATNEDAGFAADAVDFGERHGVCALR